MLRTAKEWKNIKNRQEQILVSRTQEDEGLIAMAHQLLWHIGQDIEQDDKTPEDVLKLAMALDKVEMTLARIKERQSKNALAIAGVSSIVKSRTRKV